MIRTIRRPLLLCLAAVTLGLRIAFCLGADLGLAVPLDAAIASGNTEAVAEGVIASVESGDYSGKILLEDCRLQLNIDTPEGDAEDASSDNCSLIVYVSDINGLSAGDRVKVSGTLRSIMEPDNPGEFNTKLYYRTRDISYIMNGGTPEIITRAGGLGAALAGVKYRLSAVLYEAAEDEEEAGLYKAVLLGDRSGLDEQTYELFQVSGVAHILAVSGLHLSLIAEVIRRILRSLRVPHVLSALISGSLLACYVIMIDGGASARRALIMFILSLIAPLIGRTYDSLTALGLSGLLLLAGQPLYALDSGFLLSYMAIAGIGIIYPVLQRAFTPKPAMKAPAVAAASDRQRRRDKIREALESYLLQPLLMSLSVSLSTLPVLVGSYYTISPYGIILNLVALPLISVAMVSLLLCALTGLVWQPLGEFWAGAAHLVFKGLTGLCSVASRLPGASLVAGEPEWWQVTAYYMLLGAVMTGYELYVSRHRKKRESVKRDCGLSADEVCGTGRGTTCPGKISAAALLLALLLAPVILVHTGSRGTTLTALYVGQGDCTVIRSDDGGCVIIDCGSSDKNDVAGTVILPYLKSCGISRVDLIMLSHGDDDHVNGLEGLLSDRAISVGMVAVSAATYSDESWETVIDIAEESDADLCLLDAGDEVMVGGMTFAVLSPQAVGVDGASSGVINGQKTPQLYFDDENDNSMVILMRKGNFEALFPGDISSTTEDALVDWELLPDVDYLKCPHHGSRYSSSMAFLQVLSPAVVTVSDGRNNLYGHPSDVTLERITIAGASYFRTDTLGAVTSTVIEDEPGDGSETVKISVDCFKNKNKQ